eukprot:TRINITY_DN3866_c0_g1_i1.p1 TRINITY_DN3866_c0_g1~~TRINITY_DN3866_c0_g1_i1.p1  ORF type:complete len:186 (+),score=23.12 TRINITY_DN3866_c0_g1_i1:111-668(+)
MCIRDRYQRRVREISRRNMSIHLFAVLSLAHLASALNNCGCNTGVRYSPSGCTVYTGQCSALEDKSDCWLNDLCYSKSKDRCCDANSGAVAGLVIGLLIALALAICCCCYFCPSCPWARSRESHLQQTQQYPVVITGQAQIAYPSQPVAAAAHPVYIQQQPQQVQPPPMYNEPQSQPAVGVNKQV